MKLTKELNYRTIWSLAWPIILTNLTIPLIGATNVAVMGRLSDPKYIGGVSLGVLILQSIYWSFAFLRKSTTGITAQAFGAQNRNEICLSLLRSLLIAFVLSLLVILLQGLICQVAFCILQGSEEVEKLAKIYVNIRIWATFPTLANYALLGWFYGIQKPKLALVLRTLMNLLNIPLTIFLVLTLKMNVAGAAWSALVSQIFVCVLSLWVAYKEIKIISNNGNFDFISKLFDLKPVIKIFKINRDIFIRTALVYLAFSWFTAASAKVSDLTLAANTILINLFWFISYALEGFANVTESLTGQAVGADDPEFFDRAIVLSINFSFVFAILLSVFFFFGQDWILALMTSQSMIKIKALEYFSWLIFIPLTGLWCFQADAVFVGMTQTTYMRNAMMICFAIYSLAISFLPLYLGDQGLWLALHIFMIVRALTLWCDFPKARKIIFTKYAS